MPLAARPPTHHFAPVYMPPLSGNVAHAFLPCDNSHRRGHTWQSRLATLGWKPTHHDARRRCENIFPLLLDDQNPSRSVDSARRSLRMAEPSPFGGRSGAAASGGAPGLYTQPCAVDNTPASTGSDKGGNSLGIPPSFWAGTQSPA